MVCSVEASTPSALHCEECPFNAPAGNRRPRATLFATRQTSIDLIFCLRTAGEKVTVSVSIRGSDLSPAVGHSPLRLKSSSGNTASPSAVVVCSSELRQYWLQRSRRPGEPSENRPSSDPGEIFPGRRKLVARQPVLSMNGRDLRNGEIPLRRKAARLHSLKLRNRRSIRRSRTAAPLPPALATCRAVSVVAA